MPSVRFSRSMLLKRKHEEFVSIMREFINDIVMHVKAFDGDIYGSIMREFRINNNILISNINCRVDLCLLHYLLQVLCLHFEVSEIPQIMENTNTFTDYLKRYKIHPKRTYSSIKGRYYDISNPQDYSIQLHVTTMSRMDWLRLPCDFDVNILGENSTSMYMRSSYLCLNKYVDRINHITNRIKQNTFSILDPTCHKTSVTIISVVDKAAKLCSNGWLMDDTLWGDNSWIVNTWLKFQLRPKQCRTFYTENKLNQLTNLDECPLCNEKFHPCDVVINTKCNHNFHWSYVRRQNENGEVNVCKGVKEWVRMGNLTCPCCRNYMF